MLSFVLKVALVALVLASSPAHSLKIVAQFEIPGELPDHCKNTALYTSEAKLRENEQCSMKMMKLVVSYLRLLPVLNKTGVIPEEMRGDRVKKAKEIFGYYNAFLLNVGAEKMMLDIEQLLPID